jgi:hypothetical protein
MLGANEFPAGAVRTLRPIRVDETAVPVVNGMLMLPKSARNNAVFTFGVRYPL